MSNRSLKFIEKYNIQWILLIVIGIGIVLRFYGLTIQSYWVDELFTLFTANPSATFSESLHRVFHDLVHPPVYNILLWIWFKLFGFTEYVGRSFSAFTGVLSIIAMYYLGKEIFNKNVGVYAAILVTFNYFLIYFSQEARSYSLFLLFSILSYLFLFKTIRTKSIYNAFLYTFFTLLLIYTHYFGFFLIASQFIVFVYLAVIEIKNRKKLIYIGIVVMVIITLSIAPVLYSILNSDATIAAERMRWCYAPSPYFFLTYMKTYFSYQVIPFAILLIVLAVKMYQQKIKNSYIVYALIIWIFICYLFPYLKSIISYPILAPRYTIYVVPAMILLVAVAIDSIENKKFKYLLVALIVLSSVFRIYRYDYYTKPQKEEWRKIANYIISDSRDLPVYTPYYYQGHKEHFNTYFEILKSEKHAFSIDQLTQELNLNKAPDSFWIISAHGNKNLLPMKLINKYSLIKIDEIKGIQAIGVLYKR